MAIASERLLLRIPKGVAVAAAVLMVGAGSVWAGRVSPLTPLFAAVAILIVLVATIADPRVGLGALAFAMVLSPEVGRVVYVRADDVVLGAVVLGWLARQAVYHEPLRENPMLVPMVLLAVAGLAAFGLSVASGNIDPFSGERVSVTVAALHWVKRVEYFAIAFLVGQALKTRTEVAAFAGLLLVAGGVVAVRGILQIVLHGAEPAFRLGAPFDAGEANTLGEYFVLLIALGLGVFLNVGSARARFAVAGVVAMMFYAFLHTYSRGSYVALVVVVLLAALFKDARILLVVGGLILILPSQLPAGITARIESIPQEIAAVETSDVGGNAFLARVDSYRVAARKVIERPVLGYGPGVVALARIESQYARESIDGGIIGLGLFIWFLTRAARLGREVLAAARQRLDLGIGLGYLAGVAGMAAAALGAIPFTTIRTMEAFCFVTGLAVVLWRLQREELKEATPA